MQWDEFDMLESGCHVGLRRLGWVCQLYVCEFVIVNILVTAMAKVFTGVVSSRWCGNSNLARKGR
jgi:hypothetical protein